MNNEKQNVEIILYKNNDMSSMTCSSKSSSTKTSTSKTGTQRLLLLLCPPATAMLYVVYLTDPHFTRVQDKSQDHCTYIMETTPLVSGQKKFHLRPCFRSCCFSAAGLGGASHRQHVIVTKFFIKMNYANTKGLLKSSFLEFFQKSCPMTRGNFFCPDSTSATVYAAHCFIISKII